MRVPAANAAALPGPVRVIFLIEAREHPAQSQSEQSATPGIDGLGGGAKEQENGDGGEDGHVVELEAREAGLGAGDVEHLVPQRIVAHRGEAVGGGPRASGADVAVQKDEDEDRVGEQDGERHAVELALGPVRPQRHAAVVGVDRLGRLFDFSEAFERQD